MVTFNTHPTALTWRFWLGLLCAVFLLGTYIPAAWQQQAVRSYEVRDLIDPRSVFVEDTMQGEPVLLTVDRGIHGTFNADWAVRVRTYPEKTVVCEAQGGGTYDPDAELPEPVTLAWWAFTEPRCAGHLLPSGRYVIDTTWTVEPPASGLPVRSVSVSSNPFRVLPRDVPLEPVQRYQGLQGQIELLQQEIIELKGVDG